MPIKPGDTVKTVTRGAIDSHYHGLWTVVAIDGDRVIVSKATPDPTDWATEFSAYLDEIKRGA